MAVLEGVKGLKNMVRDLPDYTRDMHITIDPTLLSQVRTLPWWVRYTPARVLYLDDFEGVLKWNEISATVTRETSIEAFEGAYCLSLVSDAIIGAEATAELLLGGIPRSKIAVQLKWHPYESADNIFGDFWVTLTFADGSYFTAFIIAYTKNWVTPQNKWYYMDENEHVTEIPGGAETIETTFRAHQSLYFTCDFRLDSLRYGVLKTSKLDLDLSTLKPYHIPYTGPPGLAIEISAEPGMDAAAHAYVDAFCLSDMEI